jgi:hypothetical protein
MQEARLSTSQSPSGEALSARDASKDSYQVLCGQKDLFVAAHGEKVVCILL